MPGSDRPASADRVFVRDGRKHHRRTYSRTEFRIGLVVLALLAGLVAWVAWRGGRPDPALFAAPEATLAGAEPAAVPAAVPAARGPLPGDLAATGWREAGLSSFDPSDLYVKIDGREDYYKSFGFRRLWCLTLESLDDASRFVDVEAFDLGEAANALGAYAGERPEGVSPEVREDGLAHFDRNALFLARGPWYVRAIGSDETAATRAQLERIRERLEETLGGEPLPWAWALFVGGLGVDPGQVAYAAENAFSFGFARDVYSAVLPDETEPFVVAAADAEAAAALARRFTQGFLEYGEPAGTSDGVAWTADRYIATIAGAKAVDRWTIGVRGAPDRAAAEAALRDLESAVRALPPGTATAPATSADPPESPDEGNEP